MIDRWLKGKRNFIVGRSLYNLYGGDDALKRLFMSTDSSYARERLADELQAIFDSGERPAERADIAVIEPQLKESDDPVVQSLNVSWKEKFQRMKTLQAELRSYGNSNRADTVGACERLCAEILEIEQELMALWQTKDIYEKTGEMPRVKKTEYVPPVDSMELAKEINNLKRNIRRQKLNLKKNPANAKYAALQNTYEERLKQIENAQN